MVLKPRTARHAHFTLRYTQASLMNVSTAASREPQRFSILLFAGLRDAMKCEQITVSISRGAEPGGAGESSLTVADLLRECAVQFPQLARWLPHVRVAVNLEYSSAATLLQPGDEIAFIPPVAGG